MNSRSVLVLILFLLWSAASGWYYVCKIKQKCEDNTEQRIDDKNVVNYLYGGTDAIQNDGFDAFKLDLINKLGTSNRLSITGLYGPLENLTSSEDLGRSRAISMRNLFYELDDSRFDLISKQVEMDSTEYVSGVEWKILTNNDFVEQTLDGATIYFGTASAEGQIDPLLDEFLSNLVNENKDASFSVVGHSDNTGTDEENKQLSVDRAGTIQDILIEKGMPAEQISVLSMGSDAPIENNDTEENRARKRRVEITISK